ncbi:MAG TPA: FCD domain-containing protein, partial [Hyphomicrobiaceae bacterium]|nr:FCD domain-containing protein [Hyphomicrobiaceae bacterium]
DQALAHGSGMPATASMIDRVQADVAFHNALNGMSGNPQIATTIAEQWPHFMRSMGVVLQSLGTRARVWQEHAEIADAVLAGDRQRAGKCAREHTRHAGEDTARSIENIPAVA